MCSFPSRPSRAAVICPCLQVTGLHDATGTAFGKSHFSLSLAVSNCQTLTRGDRLQNTPGRWTGRTAGRALPAMERSAGKVTCVSDTTTWWAGPSPLRASPSACRLLRRGGRSHVLAVSWESPPVPYTVAYAVIGSGIGASSTPKRVTLIREKVCLTPALAKRP